MRYAIFFLTTMLLTAASLRADEWNFAAGTDGWVNTGTSGVENYRAQDGMLQWDYVPAEPFDPYLVKGGLSINAATHPYVVIESAVRAGGDGAIRFQFFFDNGSGFAGGDPFREFALGFDTRANQGIVKYILHAPTTLGGNAGDWSGTLVNLRIDPGREGDRLPGNTGVIDRVAVLTAGDLADETYQWDFETGLQGWSTASGSVNLAWVDGDLQVTYNDPDQGNFDPVVEYAAPLLFDADAMRWLRIDVAVIHATNDPILFEVFAFPRTGGNLRTTFNVTPNEGRRAYFVDMTSLAPNAPETEPWAGLDTIRTIRIDPGVDFDDPQNGSNFANTNTRFSYMSLSDGSLDPDRDGLSDIREQQLGTDPANPDTDSDGVNDGNELVLGADPLTPSSLPAANAWTMWLLAVVLVAVGMIVVRRWGQLQVNTR